MADHPDTAAGGGARACPQCGSTDIMYNGYLFDGGRSDCCRRCSAPVPSAALDAPAPPAPGATAGLDAMAERLRSDLKRWHGLDLSPAIGADLLAYALTGMPGGPDRDAALSRPTVPAAAPGAGDEPLTLEIMAKRLRGFYGDPDSFAEAEDALSTALTGERSNPGRAAKVAAILSRLAQLAGGEGAALEVDGAAPLGLAGAVPSDGLREVMSDAVNRIDALPMVMPGYALWNTLQDLMLAFRAALARGGAPGEGWRPIETAPDGDSDILLFCPSTGQQFVGFRTPDGWQYACAREGYAIVCEPTHWRPLPAPPASGRGGDHG